MKYEDYFNEEGKQLKPLPKKWLDLSRFKVGDKIEHLRDDLVHIPCEECLKKDWYHHGGVQGDCKHLNMKGQVGVVVAVHSGSSSYPSRWREDDSDDGGFWITDRPGRLTVRFPYDLYGKEKDGKTYKPRACLAQDEGIVWRKVK